MMCEASSGAPYGGVVNAQTAPIMKRRIKLQNQGDIRTDRRDLRDRSSLEGGILKSHFGGGSTPHKRVGEENGKVIVSARAGQATERTC